MKTYRPKTPPPLRDDGFPKRTAWNPRKPVSGASNHPPQSMWPHKRGSAVFAFDRYDNIRSGRVAWYNPAREIDRSCLVTPGHPFFKVYFTDEEYAMCSADEVFPFTDEGWRSALNKLAEELSEESRKCISAASLLERKATQLRKLANKQTKTTKP